MGGVWKWLWDGVKKWLVAAFTLSISTQMWCGCTTHAGRRPRVRWAGFSIVVSIGSPLPINSGGSSKC